MAIVVQEENESRGGIMKILIWVVVLGVIGAAIYYVFFQNVGLIETITPSGFQNTAELARIKLNPDEVINNPRFQSLKPYVTPIAPHNPGKSNPFLSF